MGAPNRLVRSARDPSRATRDARVAHLRLGLRALEDQPPRAPQGGAGRVAGRILDHERCKVLRAPARGERGGGVLDGRRGPQ